MLGSDRPPAALAEHTGFLMNWCANRSRRRMTDALQAELGIHPREFGVLSVIAGEGGTTQQALGERAGVDPSTMVATLDALEARGLARREPDPEDRRRRVVRITPAGEEAVAEGRRIARDVGQETFAALSAAEREQLNKLLRKLSGLD